MEGNKKDNPGWLKGYLNTNNNVEWHGLPGQAKADINKIYVVLVYVSFEERAERK